MSRILRRPMFRGGPVDSRGTGITSGLNYAKGGSVNTPKRGLVDGPGGYAGMGTGGYYDSLLGKGIRSVRDYVGKPFLNFINQDIANPILSLGGHGDFFERMETPWDDKYLLGLDENYDKIPADEYVPYSARYSNKGKGPIETDSGAIPKAIQKQEDIIRLEELEELKLKRKEEAEQALINKMKGSKKTKKEQIEEYKEMFEDAYGSGVADDASNMLLNFAGKALKPEATVKSAFGEFFEEEGKRPSERKKYKDAATTAAINAFLTGEKTMAEVEAYMAKVTGGEKAKLKLLTDVATSQSLNKRISDKAGKYNTKTAAFKGELPLFLEDNEISYKGITYIDEEKVKLEGENAQEKVGEVFVDVDNNVVFIVVLENGVLKKKYLNK